MLHAPRALTAALVAFACGSPPPPAAPSPSQTTSATPAAASTALPIAALAPPATALRFTLLSGTKPSGTASQTRGPDGAIVQHVDAGEDGKADTTLTVDAAGLPIELSTTGQSWQGPYEERLERRGPRATWRDRTGAGELADAAFYLPPSMSELVLGLLARALAVAPGHQLAVSHGGRAAIARVASLRVDGADGPREVTLYRIAQLDRLPIPIWLDERGDLFASSDGWNAIIRAGYDAAMPALARAQDADGDAQRAAFASLARRPAALVVRGARAFDPETLRVTDHTSVVIVGGKLAAVGRDAEVAAPAGAEVIDARGRFLMPGLWDNHAHFWSPSNPLVYLATGVTTVREMGNVDTLPAWVARIHAGVEPGPRVLMVKNVSGPGDDVWRANQTFGGTAEELEAVAARAAAEGYAQIKVRDVPPALVPGIVRAAHARGLRLSGHIPKGMNALTFAEAGTDEIQHLGFLVPALLPSDLPPTDRAARLRAFEALTPASPALRRMIELFLSRKVAVDVTRLGPTPTAAGDVPGELRYLLAGSPLGVRHALPRNAVDARAFAAHAKLLTALDAAGVVLVPGTDGSDLAGLLLRAELEAWVAAGLPAARVLRMATLGSARNMGITDAGTLAVGSRADLLLIDGDPTQAISDLRKLDVVIAGGAVYDPRALLARLGFALDASTR